MRPKNMCKSARFVKMALWQRLSGILLFLFPLVQQTLSEKFTVAPSRSLVITTVGSIAELTFLLSPETSATNMGIQIFKSSPDLLLLLYVQGKVSIESTAKEYQGRTNFKVDNLKSGRIILQIHNVVPFDKGRYQCIVQPSDSQIVSSSSLEVLVTAFGTDPMIRMVNYSNEGIAAECKSEWWYPEPKMMWKDSKGNALMALDTQKSTSDLELFTVKSSIAINSSVSVTCSVKTDLLNEGKQLTIYISDTMYNRVNRCGISSYIKTVVGIAIVLLVSVYLFVHYHQSSQLEDAHFQEIDNPIKELETNMETLDMLKKCLRATRTDMALDPETAHPLIDVTDNGQHAKYMQTAGGGRCQTCIQQREKCATCMSRSQKTHDRNSKRFHFNYFILGSNEIVEGMHLFEFWLDNECGAIGVCKTTVQRDKKIDLINRDADICVVQLYLYDHIDFKKESPNLRMYLDCHSGNLILITMNSEKIITEEIPFKDEKKLFFVGFIGYNEFLFVREACPDNPNIVC